MLQAGILRAAYNSTELNRFGLLLLTLVPAFGRAQDAAPPETPRPAPVVGLALGGGSARGMAHAGVLQWLEEHRIPIRRVAGTSTGALMGASYAAGMSPDEIQGYLRNADWDTILRPDIPYRQRSYRRKEDDRDFSVEIEAGLRHGLRLQSGLNPGPHLSLMVSRILLPASGIANFDDLPIPFRCVATDLEKGQSVVFSRGPIASAVRASMSLPGTYDPIRIEGRLLADGGILNNVPVDVVRDMGADVVIAVRVGPPPEEETPETIGGIASRAITLMMQALERPRLRRAEIVIAPRLEGLHASDFRRVNEFIARGYAAAEAQKEALLAYALDEAGWARHTAERAARRPTEPPPASFVEVSGVSDGAGTQIAAQLVRHVGKPASAVDLEADISRVVGLGRYASATYGRKVQADGEGVAVEVREKPYGPPFVRFALDVDNDSKDVNLNVGARVTMMDVTGLGSEWRFDVSGGSVLSVGTELYQPLGGERPVRGGAFLSPRAGYTRISENLYDGEALVAIYGRQRAGAGLDVGWNSGGATRLRAGYEAAYIRNATRVGDPSRQLGSGSEHSVRARFDYDGREAPYLSDHGLRITTSAQWLFRAPDATGAFGSVEGTVRAATSVGRLGIASVSLEGGAQFGARAPSQYAFSLGGPFRLSAFPRNALRGPKYGLATVGLRHAIARLPKLVGRRVYATAVAEAGGVFENAKRMRVKSSLTGGLTADTVLGPIFAGASVGAEGDYQMYFLIGRQVR